MLLYFFKTLIMFCIACVKCPHYTAQLYVCIFKSTFYFRNVQEYAPLNLRIEQIVCNIYLLRNNFWENIVITTFYCLRVVVKLDVLKNVKQRSLDPLFWSFFKVSLSVNCWPHRPRNTSLDDAQWAKN